jgi:hypothetical protein
VLTDAAFWILSPPNAAMAIKVGNWRGSADSSRAIRPALLGSVLPNRNATPQKSHEPRETLAQKLARWWLRLRHRLNRAADNRARP